MSREFCLRGTNRSLWRDELQVVLQEPLEERANGNDMQGRSVVENDQVVEAGGYVGRVVDYFLHYLQNQPGAAELPCSILSHYHVDEKKD